MDRWELRTGCQRSGRSNGPCSSSLLKLSADVLLAVGLAGGLPDVEEGDIRALLAAGKSVVTGSMSTTLVRIDLTL